MNSLPACSKRSYARAIFGALIGLASLVSLPAQKPAVFVNLSTTQAATAGVAPTSAATFTIAAPGNGWDYGAAAPYSGETWNNIISPHNDDRVVPSVKGYARYDVVPLITANNIALTQPDGSASGVTLTAAAVLNDAGTATNAREVPRLVNVTNSTPSGLLGTSWRIFESGNLLRFSFSGLPVDAHYLVYCYATTNAANQGARFTLAASNSLVTPALWLDTNPAANTAPSIFVLTGGVTVPSTPAPLQVASNAANSANASTTWSALHAKVDSAGKIVVDVGRNANNNGFPNGFQLIPYPKATITTNLPATTSATLNNPVTLTVAASGFNANDVLTYQWRKGGVNIPSATSATYSIASILASDEGNYDVVVTNYGGDIVSAPTALTVATSSVAPSISLQPTGKTAVTGGSATFTVSANGTSPLVYTWQKSVTGTADSDFTNLDSNSTSLALANVTTVDAGYYRVKIANGTLPDAVSDAVPLIVAPVINTPPAGAVVAVGSPASLSVVAMSGPATAPFAPTYEWKRNGVVVTDGNGISGATTATLSFASFAVSNSGTYTVTAANAAGAVTSDPVYLGTATTLTSELFPAMNATGVNPDTPLTINFSAAPVVGTVGQVRVYDASNDSLVATVDLSTLKTISAPSGNPPYRTRIRTVGGQEFGHQPIVVVGQSARIFLPSSTTLAYGKTYYVKIDPGAIVDSAGASYAGINDTSTWRFSTKAAGPDASAATLTVSADGTGDFSTVQGAIDFIPYSPANTIPRTINVKNGTYHEIVHVRTGQDQITIQGESRTGTIIQHLNNNEIMNGTVLSAHFYKRTGFLVQSVGFNLFDVTVRNLTVAGGSQAEAFIVNSAANRRVTVSRCNFYSYQDTIYSGPGTFFTDCYIEGDVDFMWGSGTFFQRCEIKAIRGGYYTQIRNAPGTYGNVYVDCRLTAAPDLGAATVALSRIDPAGFPESQVVFINSAMGPHIKPQPWQLDGGATTAPVIKFWEYQSTDLSGVLLDVSTRPTYNAIATGVPGAAAVLPNQQIDAITAAYYRDPSNIAGYTPSVAPAIDTQPTGGTVEGGDSVTITVGATLGYPTATFQWKKDGVDLPGATQSSLNLSNVQGTDAGSYTVTVSNSAGSVTSEAAVLSVNTVVIPTAITTQPANVSVTEGQIATFSVAAEGTNLTYQWRKDGSDIAGANESSLVLVGVQSSDVGAYSVVVTGRDGTVTSSSATLAVSARTLSTVFTDTFTTGSTVNQAAETAASETATGYQVLSDKSYNPTPSLAAGALRYGIGGTSSGNIELQALFGTGPVILSGLGDYIEFTATFTNVAGMFTAANNTLYVGLYDTNQVAPVPGGLNGRMTGSLFTHGTDYAKDWQGYASRTFYSGGSHSIMTRPRQIGNTNQVQSVASVAFRTPTGAAVGTPQLSTLTGFTAGARYTTVLRITRSAVGEYTIKSDLYEGEGTTGALLVSFSAPTTEATFLTDNSDNLGFDGFALGHRVAGAGQTIELNSVRIITNASLIPVPKITTQPQSQTVAVGAPAVFNVAAEGPGLSYQWYKNNVAISGANDSLYSVTSAKASDQGNYKVVVTNSLGGRSSSATAELIVDIAAGAPAPDGFATGVTGGGNRAAVIVATAADLKAAAEQASAAVINVSGVIDLSTVGGSIAVQSNKTIQGIDSSSAVRGTLNLGSGAVDNVIIRGLTITNPGTTVGEDGRYTDGGDGISVRGATNVFITHCTIYDCADGLIDIGFGSDNVTVSWCEFYFTSAALLHRFTMITGNAGAETKPLHVTLHHNLWHDNCDQRMPSGTYGYVHLYNNYFNTPGNSYASNARDLSQFLSEHNAYHQVKSPLYKENVDTTLAGGRIRAIDNRYSEITGNAPDAGEDTVFTPSYSYHLLPAADVGEIVLAGAGNTAGAASSSLPVATATLAGPTVPVPVNTSFTLTPTVTGFTPSTYQWRRNNFNVAGATGSTFTVDRMQTSHEGVYSLVLTDAEGDQLVSSSVNVVYSSALVPVINTQPTSLSVVQGAAAMFTVVAGGDEPLTYQWQKLLNGAFTNVTGANSSSFGFGSAQPVHAGQYRVVVTNAVGTATSSTVTLTVNASDSGSGTGDGSSGAAEGGGGALSVGYLLALLALAATRRVARRE